MTMAGFGQVAENISHPNRAETGGSGSAHDVAEGVKVADNAMQAKWAGTLTQAQYDAWRLEQQSAREAREYETMLANSAWQRKVADLEKAGFSPLAALDASGQGAAVASSQVARASGNGANPPNILGSLITAIALIASKGLTAAQTAKTATEVAAIKAQNRLALAALYRRR